VDFLGTSGEWRIDVEYAVLRAVGGGWVSLGRDLDTGSVWVARHDAPASEPVWQLDRSPIADIRATDAVFGDGISYVLSGNSAGPSLAEIVW